jgi:hypothetical protein
MVKYFTLEKTTEIYSEPLTIPGKLLGIPASLMSFSILLQKYNKTQHKTFHKRCHNASE